jgi:hypothetical protein
MKKSRFTEQQIAFALQQAEGGTSVEEVCRKMGISQATFFRWKKVYGRLIIARLLYPCEDLQVHRVNLDQRPNVSYWPRSG